MRRQHGSGVCGSEEGKDKRDMLSKREDTATSIDNIAHAAHVYCMGVECQLGKVLHRMI